jgi:hypothetical protein
MISQWYYEQAGAQHGPCSREELLGLFNEERINRSTLVWSAGLGPSWKPLYATDLYEGPPPITAAHLAVADVSQGDETIRRIADYERISGILWICIGVIQICLIYTFIAGVWNVFAGISRLKIVKRIRNFDAEVPSLFEGLAGLVIIGIVNLLLGGIIGLLFVGLDFYIRDLVLTNKHRFINPQLA